MERRVGRVLHEALGLALAAAGAAAGLVRHLPQRRRAAAAPASPPRIGLDPTFTVDDRGDSEDLIHLLRQRLGLASGGEPLSAEGDLPGDLLARRQRAGKSARRRARRDLSLVPRPRRTACSACSPPTPPRSRRSACSTSTTCSSGGPRRWPIRRSAPRSPRASTMSSSTSTRTPIGCRPRSCSRLRPDGSGLTVVGDDAQSIYSFRAAEVRNILDFAAALHAARRRCSTLEQNYRSTAPLLAASNAVIALAARAPRQGALERPARRASGRRWSGSRTRRPRRRGSPSASSRCASRAWR